VLRSLIEEIDMVTKVVRQGDSLAIVLDPGLLEQAGIREGMALQVEAAGHALVLREVREDRESRLDAAILETNLQFGDALRRLGE
jgi:antitoxin component of MazEF toxin-antitoxin module